MTQPVLTPIRIGRLSVGGLFLALLAATGCSSGTSVVVGKVTYKGKPVTMGTVTLQTPTGAFQGPIQSDGSYEVKGVPVGTAKVAVTATDEMKLVEENKKRVNAGREAAKSGDKPKQLPSIDLESYSQIPLSYGDPEKSKLTVEVKGSKTEHNIDLQ